LIGVLDRAQPAGLKVVIALLSLRVGRAAARLLG
jgi:hypothetical protein